MTLGTEILTRSPLLDADEIEGENEGAIRESGVQRARGEQESKVRGYTRVRNRGDV